MKTYLILFLWILILLPACNEKTKYVQPELGSRALELLEVDGFQFKDLNKNEVLDNYEDWRLTTDERVADLLSQMTLEEKVGFMIISTINMAGSSMRPVPGAPRQKITSDLSEEETVMDRNFFTRKPLPIPALFISGTTKGVNERHLRHFIIRANTDAKTMAEWSNKLQALSESTRLGIPVILASNPRNHITNDYAIGIGLGRTVFSKWPGTLGLAAMRDLELTREFAESAAKEWVAVGIRKGYQYMADLATEPRWARTEGTLGNMEIWQHSWFVK